MRSFRRNETGNGRTNDIDFRFYVEIEQHRYGILNEMF